MSLKAGEIIIFEQTFTLEDVEMFTKVSGDKETHHLVPDESGRLIIQGPLPCPKNRRAATCLHER